MPDIVSVMNLSDLYQISIDDLLKGDRRMKEKLEKDVTITKNNKKLHTLRYGAFCLNAEEGT